MFPYKCDSCGRTFTDTHDCANTPCGQCEDGKITLDCRPEEDIYLTYLETHHDYDSDDDRYDDDDYDQQDRDQCDRCGGDGVLDYLDAGPDVWGEDCPSLVDHLVTCPDCGGTGLA
jgi:hypothetical protein